MKMKKRLCQLQCHFTWDLDLDVDLETLSTRLQIDIDFHQRQHEGESCTYSLLAYVRYSFWSCLMKEKLKWIYSAHSNLNAFISGTLERYGDESEKRLIVTYGDMAWLKYHDGDFAQSQSYCQRIEDILYPTGSSGSLLPEVYGEQGWAYFKVSRSSISKAIDCFRKALEVQPHDTEWNAGYAVVLFCGEQVSFMIRMKSIWIDTTKQLRFALEINPNNAALQCMLAMKLVAYKKYEEADDLVKKALENDPDNPHILRHSGKYLLNQVIRASITALLRGDQLSSFNYQLAMCYKQKKIAEQCCGPFKEGKWRRCCISHLEEAVEMKPSFVRVLAELALLYAEEGDLSRCLSKQKLKEKRVCLIIHQYYGDFLHYHIKNEAQAIAHYKEELKQIADRRLAKNWGDGEALALLGQVARAEGDRKRAAFFYEKALNCDKDNEEYLSALCELRLELQ
uniref:Interferon-induced protein with tetratricopeptide repeats 5 n=1 Tax=Maylandia zebra TaxID=106582 RepID=A0A3P9B151_9CICH